MVVEKAKKRKEGEVTPIVYRQAPFWINIHPRLKNKAIYMSQFCAEEQKILTKKEFAANYNLTFSADDNSILYRLLYFEAV